MTTGTNSGRAPIVTLWLDGRLPIEDGLYLATGDSYAVEWDSASRGIEIIEEFDLAELLDEDPEWTTSMDITREEELADGSGYLCCGEGSHGSEGFFARLDADRTLVWVVYFEESNPFTTITRDGALASFTSTSGRTVTVNIDEPARQAPAGS